MRHLFLFRYMREKGLDGRSMWKNERNGKMKLALNKSSKIKAERNQSGDEAGLCDHGQAIMQEPH